MANTNVNRINTAISETNTETINTSLAATNAALDGSTVALNDEERNTLFGLSVENKEFAQDTLKQGQQLFSKLPPAMQAIVENLKTDLTLNGQMETIADTLVAPLLLRISDTKRLSGHEAYVGALALYKIIEAMAGMGIEGFQAAYDVLKSRFEGQGGSAAQPNP
jgi:hypothetical protein